MSTGSNNPIPSPDQPGTPSESVSADSAPRAVAVPSGQTRRAELSPQGPVSESWTPWHTVGLLLIIVAIGVLGMTRPPGQAYVAFLLLLTAFIAIVGHAVVGLWCGSLIDERNRLSLSCLQMAIWTVVVLSGFLAAALWNISQNSTAPLTIAVPEQLWWVMGISTTSLVGSALIRSTKMRGPDAAPSQELIGKKEEERTRTVSALVRQGLPENTVATKGSLVVWKWPTDARLADLFQGDEVGNAAHIDLGKVQMFLFTLIVVFAYAVSLGHTFFGVSPGVAVHELPALDQGMVALLSISHAGFLTNKAVPHSAT